MEHTTRHEYRALYNAANNGVVNFFCTIVDKTGYQYLKDYNSYYSDITASDMLAHFRANYRGLHEVDAITIQVEMMDYFGQEKDIPQ